MLCAFPAAVRDSGFVLTLRPAPDSLGLRLVARRRCREGGELLLYRRPAAATRPTQPDWLHLADDSEFTWLQELQRRLARSAAGTKGRSAGANIYLPMYL